MTKTTSSLTALALAVALAAVGAGPAHAAGCPVGKNRALLAQSKSFVITGPKQVPGKDIVCRRSTGKTALLIDEDGYAMPGTPAIVADRWIGVAVTYDEFDGAYGKGVVQLDGKTFKRSVLMTSPLAGDAVILAGGYAAYFDYNADPQSFDAVPDGPERLELLRPDGIPRELDRSPTGGLDALASGPNGKTVTWTKDGVAQSKGI